MPVRKDLKQFGESIVTQRLKFTTGGMRELLREGFNGINEVTCNILSTVLAKRYSSIVISHDSRYQSKELALVVACIFTKYNRKVYFYSHLVTPCLSYLVPTLDVEIGMMITASHNPKEYNGYKVYDRKGCQLTSPLDKEIENELLFNQLTDYNNIKFTPNKYPSREEVINLYIKNLFKWKLPSISTTANKILFTPLYGVSIDFIKYAISYYNISSFELLKEQCLYDPSFPGLPYPNPEVDQVYDRAKLNNPDLIFSCDPDGDRFGMVEKVNGEYLHYSGDEIASVFMKYFVESFDSSSLVFINTFLCNDFMEEISKKNKIKYYRTKTGFKNISKVINEVKERENHKIIFAYEDSLGFFFGEGREKDGIKSVVLMAHILQTNKPSEILNNLKKLGTFSTFNYHYRCSEPEKLIEKIQKQEKGEILHDMFIIKKENYKIILRKSGTEPLLKIYSSSKELNKETLKRVIKEFITISIDKL